MGGQLAPRTHDPANIFSLSFFSSFQGQSTSRVPGQYSHLPKWGLTEREGTRMKVRQQKLYMEKYRQRAMQPQIKKTLFGIITMSLE